MCLDYLMVVALQSVEFRFLLVWNNSKWLSEQNTSMLHIKTENDTWWNNKNSFDIDNDYLGKKAWKKAQKFYDKLMTFAFTWNCWTSCAAKRVQFSLYNIFRSSVMDHRRSTVLKIE